MSKSRDPRTGRYLNQGGFQPPPPNAPRETTQPAAPPTGEDIAAAHARAEARAAERLGGGLAFGQTSSSLSLPPRADAGEGAPDVVPHPARTPRDPDADAGARAQGDGQTLVPKEQGSGRPFLDPVRPAPRILGHAPQPEPEPVESSALDDLTESFKATHPAASTTDSPSRGIPTPGTDPGKQITGGWGPEGSAGGAGTEYFALDGGELKAIVIALAARLQQALDQDLRFGLSVVYPQVKVSLHLTVDGRSPEGRDLDLPGQEKVDLEWSRILTLDAEVEDSEETPAGKIRDDFQIRGPRKQVIRAGAARLLVDVPNEP